MLRQLVKLLDIDKEEFTKLENEANGSDITEHVQSIAKATLSLLDSGMLIDEELSSRRQRLNFQCMTPEESKHLLHSELIPYFKDRAQSFTLQDFCIWQNLKEFEYQIEDWLKERHLYKEVYEMQSGDWMTLVLEVNKFFFLNCHSDG